MHTHCIRINKKKRKKKEKDIPPTPPIEKENIKRKRKIPRVVVTARIHTHAYTRGRFPGFARERKQFSKDNVAARRFPADEEALVY